jgi:hypothetical protein
MKFPILLSLTFFNTVQAGEVVAVRIMSEESTSPAFEIAAGETAKLVGSLGAVPQPILQAFGL